MKENRLLFTNALIVLPTETINGSLAVEDGKITGIFESGTELPGFTEVDVHGKALMPGAIDTHVHMWDPSPLNYREDWACGSQCAASGGITTIIDMPLSVPPVVDKEGFQLKLDVAQKESCVDFAFWGGLTPNCVQNMEELNRLGCVAYKGFMSFANPDYPQVTDGYLVQGMRKAATFNGLIGVHAENAEVADFGSKEMSAIHCKDFAMHDDARPWWVEQEAISRAVLFARETGARLYICHMTIAQGAAFLKQAKFEGVNVSVETCPHYLLFDKTILRERGAYAKCNPPFRSRENVEKLWSYILDGTIDTLGSDHGPYRDDEKVQAGDFWKEYSGFGGFDAMLAAMLTEGYDVVDETIPLHAENPYGATKVACEELVRNYGLDSVSLRVGFVYGPGRVNECPVNMILSTLLKEGKVDWDHGSEQMLDFIYIEDCVEAIAKISLADHNPHAEYNIGGGEVIPYTRIIDKARKLFPTAPIHVGPGDLGYDNLGALSVQRAFEDFGWKPRFSIEQGMEQYMNWLKNF